MNGISPKVIKAILDDGHPVLVFLPKPMRRQTDVLDEVIGRLGRESTRAKAVSSAKAVGRAKKRANKDWSKNELLALNFLRSQGERGSMSKFAKKTGRTYWSVVSKSSTLGGSSPARKKSATDMDHDVLKLAKSRPTEAARLGKRALSLMGMPRHKTS
jgi:hypothetical protein